MVSAHVAWIVNEVHGVKVAAIIWFSIFLAVKVASVIFDIYLERQEMKTRELNRSIKAHARSAEVATKSLKASTLKNKKAKSPSTSTSKKSAPPSTKKAKDFPKSLNLADAPKSDTAVKTLPKAVTPPKSAPISSTMAKLEAHGSLLSVSNSKMSSELLSNLDKDKSQGKFLYGAPKELTMLAFGGSSGNRKGVDTSVPPPFSSNRPNRDSLMLPVGATALIPAASATNVATAAAHASTNPTTVSSTTVQPLGGITPTAVVPKHPLESVKPPKP